jgi:hypothetical protein
VWKEFVRVAHRYGISLAVCVDLERVEGSSEDINHLLRTQACLSMTLKPGLALKNDQNAERIL